MNSLKTQLVLGVSSIIMLFSDAFGGCGIPPRTLTLNRILATRMRLAEYYRAHHRLPSSLSDLPVLEKDKDNSVTDGWSRELGYFRDHEEMVMLWSLGRDGVAGGAGDDSDIAVVFQFFDGMHGKLSLGLTLMLNQDGRSVQLILDGVHDEIRVLSEEEVTAMLRCAIKASEKNAEKRR